jgi:hypothetical protein
MVTHIYFVLCSQLQLQLKSERSITAGYEMIADILALKPTRVVVDIFALILSREN